MPFSTYNGIALFGVAVKMTPMIGQRALQQTAYPGISGIESLDLGGRGRVTVVRGILTGADGTALLAAKTQLESFHDGVPRIFYDSWGAGWRNVLMGQPQYEGGFRSAGVAGYWLPYQVVMTHLSMT